VLCSNQRKIVVEWEGAPEKKVHLIQHGFDLAYFQRDEPARVRALQKFHKIPEGAYPVVGVIARYTEWKGVQYIIPAFKSLLKDHPQAHLILSNAHGDFADPIKKLLSELPKERYTEILFEPDLASLYHLFDLFVHAPVDEYVEAFGQTYVEALASGVPSVFSLSGIACDFIQHQKNAWVVRHQDAGEITAGMKALLGDDALKEKVVQEGKQSVLEQFDILAMTRRLETLYET
jgi:glycosyltransferase involved in cell wall biosynthesis